MTTPPVDWNLIDSPPEDGPLDKAMFDVLIGFMVVFGAVALTLLIPIWVPLLVVGRLARYVHERWAPHPDQP